MSAANRPAGEETRTTLPGLELWTLAQPDAGGDDDPPSLHDAVAFRKINWRQYRGRTIGWLGRIGRRSTQSPRTLPAVGMSLPQAQCQIAATLGPVPSIADPERSAKHKPELTLSARLSRTVLSAVALQQLNCDCVADPGAGLNLSLGSRGSGFGNVSLTYAALNKMVQRASGRVEVMPQSTAGEPSVDRWFELSVVVPLT
ncbi:hypothetical protein H9P43_002649 [Blastocladiella emersonii ATCC 22665]|nr:hypothetical protein H9P43_002649 [Blastocladiella emersonii ATCC 22665]